MRSVAPLAIRAQCRCARETRTFDPFRRSAAARDRRVRAQQPGHSSGQSMLKIRGSSPVAGRRMAGRGSSRPHRIVKSASSMVPWRWRQRRHVEAEMRPRRGQVTTPLRTDRRSGPSATALPRTRDMAFLLQLPISAKLRRGRPIGRDQAAPRYLARARARGVTATPSRQRLRFAWASLREPSASEASGRRLRCSPLSHRRRPSLGGR